MSALQTQLHDVQTRRGLRCAMVATPTINVVVGLDQLAAMQAAPDAPSERDRGLLADLAAASRPVHAFVFGAQTERARWTTDPELDPEQRAALGYHLVRSHLVLYRSLVDCGVALCLGAAVSPQDFAMFRAGTDEALRRLQAGEAMGDGDSEANEWVLRHLTFFTTASLARVLARTLGEQLPLCESKLARRR